MRRPRRRTFRSVLQDRDLVRVAGVHDALGGMLAQRAGFDAVWTSSFGASAARCLPDASLLTMTDYLQVAAGVQSALEVPVVADCDSGYGNALNVTRMVHEYEAAGVSAVCLEDQIFPKLNSFAGGGHTLLPTADFAAKIAAAKAAQDCEEFFVIARTEALICGLSVAAALERCHAYADSGADAVLIHSKRPTREQVEDFLAGWDGRVPVVIVPTTYPAWHADDIRKAGVSVVIYANQGLRATITALEDTFRSVLEHGESSQLEDDIASIADVFSLQGLDTWTGGGR